MKKWTVTYTLDKVTFVTEEVSGTNSADAYVNTMVKHPDAIITDLQEARHEQTHGEILRGSKYGL